MLQKVKSELIANHNFAEAENASPAELFAGIADFLLRQRATIAITVAVLIGLGLAYLATTPSMYTAQTRMIIDTRRVQTAQEATLGGNYPVDSGMVDSQVEILRSENISQAVIKQLNLTSDPEFVGSGGGLVAAVYQFIANLIPGENGPRSDFELMRRAVAAFANRLTVRRIGLSYIIQISFESLNPDRAAQIANGITDAYIVDQLDAKYEATKRAGTWLQDRLRALREQASTAERAVVEYKRANNIVSVTPGTGGSGSGGGQLLDQQQVAGLNSQLVVAQAQMSEARARMDRVQAVLARNSPDVTLDSTVTDTLKNDVITKLRSHYLDLATRAADWSAKYGSDHLAVVGLRNQMRETQNAILDELRQIAETYKSDYAIAKQRVQEIQGQLAQAVSQSQSTSKAEVTLRELESTAKSYQTLYDNFLQRYMDSVQQESFPITEARVVTPASRPLQRSSPKSLLVLALTGIGGLVFGLGIARLRDLSDRVYRTGAQIEATLQVSCVALVPNTAATLEETPALNRDVSERGGPAKLLKVGDIDLESTIVGTITKSLLSRYTQSIRSNEETPALNHDVSERRGPVKLLKARDIDLESTIAGTITKSPLSRFTESIRSIKLAIDSSRMGKPIKVIGITSTLPGEGKSTIALSLALLAAHTGARTLLLDCDLRNPSITRQLCRGTKLGLVDILSGKGSLTEILWTDPTTKLSILPARRQINVAHTNEILASHKLKTLVDTVRQGYDYVVVDLSPLAPVVDVRATTHFLDAYLFVVEWGRTPQGSVEEALKAAPAVYENMLGVVLNKVNMHALRRYGGYRGGYHYYKSYSGYDYSDD